MLGQMQLFELIVVGSYQNPACSQQNHYHARDEC